MKAEYKHLQAAHCENGVTASLLQHYGVHQITEPLAFGIGSGLFFIYIPFMKVNDGPAISFRTMPGLIFKRTCRSLNISILRQKFLSKEKARQALDNRLLSGHPAACQVGVFYLPYFPKEYRFHFNAHNLIVVGKEGDNYLISDPIMETFATMTSYELERVRFARGPLAPHGQLYYPKEAREVTDEQIKRAIVTGIKRNVRHMLYVPGNIAGISGIRYTAKKIKKWRDTLGLDKSRSYLAQLVRMQEEIGTGGGGFRFIYAAFLQQAYAYHPVDELMDVSQKFTRAGDLWRDAAIQASGIYKGRLTEQQDYNVMGDQLLAIAALEKEAFRELGTIVKRLR
ncbi:MAG: BtrH N-terminal domain-containing protein [Chitinophagaceae bacterium]|nr:BtrH N-terminal domain-containing protein [Chitinophagaceae bacterium]